MQEGLRRQIEAEYEALRAANREEEERRLARATEADAAIGGLVRERVRLFQQGMRMALSEPTRAMEVSRTLTRRIDALQGELRGRLLSAGLPEDYLQPVYQCPHCHDTGYVGEPVKERCECFTRRLRERAVESTGAGLDASETFEAYDESVYDDAPLDGTGTQRSLMAGLRARCEEYADQFPANPRRNVLMVGMSGLGKTYLLNCIGNRVHAKGSGVVKVTAYQLNARMRAAVFESKPEAFSVLLEVPLLLLDDLGAEPMLNTITVEHLFTLLNERMLAGLHTVVSTNLMLDELQRRYTERVCSRLFDKRNTLMLHFRGRDVRMRPR